MTPEIAQAQDLGSFKQRVADVEKLATKVEDRLDKLIWWLIGIQFTSVLALIGVVVQLARSSK